MDLEVSNEQKRIQKSVREFMLKEVEPIADEIDKNDYFPEDLWKKLGKAEILGVNVAEEYGGSGYDVLTTVLVMEQMGRISPSVALSVGANINLCAHNLEKNGNEEQKRQYLPSICSGEIVGCLGLTEPEAGSDAVGIQTTAEKTGDDYFLNGSKTFITNAPVADIALVYAKTEPEKGAKGITAFIVEKGFEGFSVSKNIEKIGHRGSPTGELVFNNCRVPAENVLGEVNQGIKVMMRGLDVERVVVAGMALGIGEAALELALKYSKQRRQFGEKICNFQLVKAKLADMYTQLEASRYLIYRAAVLAGNTDNGGKGTVVHKIAAAAILFTAETVTKAVDQSLQIHGGYGYTMDFPINRFYRDAKLYEIGAGTSEIRRILIANELIKRGLGY
ncbi:isovaleryl-CoA dehydrogenase [Desulfosarcina alkanivorans]|jgi:isovaleryl-CoA dehydrogenase|uniref:Isovaleryl-CoA dehydrogenase n=1 Tax=Desulfosarcina alkanivorans TaxID=571177 RepID=A0A5K7YYR5_9BACT|nr:acyl-CoA dehydrogenase family protein [Desulfosarcina alkanivorans]BBO69747.1 isovaleryl-CoA dehydrogenase [Desulfosarcina alkanivorans]